MRLQERAFVGRWRDRVVALHRDPTGELSERHGLIAVDDHAFLGRLGRVQIDREVATVELFIDEVVRQLHCLDVQIDDLLAPRPGALERFLDEVASEIEQRRRYRYCKRVSRSGGDRRWNLEPLCQLVDDVVEVNLEALHASITCIFEQPRAARRMPALLEIGTQIVGEPSVQKRDVLQRNVGISRGVDDAAAFADREDVPDQRLGFEGGQQVYGVAMRRAREL